MKSLVGRLAATWGVGGVVAMLVAAIWRLSQRTLEAFQIGLEPIHWVVLVVFTGFMIYSEGIRGFQQAFSPRVAARARHLSRNPRPFHVALAPLFCMAFFHATRTRCRATWILTAGIVAVVWVFQQIDQPLRGILDAGVVAGLGWGVVTVVYFAVRAWTDDDFDFDPAIPIGGDST